MEIEIRGNERDEEMKRKYEMKRKGEEVKGKAKKGKQRSKR